MAPSTPKHTAAGQDFLDSLDIPSPKSHRAFAEKDTVAADAVQPEVLTSVFNLNFAKPDASPNILANAWDSAWDSTFQMGVSSASISHSDAFVMRLTLPLTKHYRFTHRTRLPSSNLTTSAWPKIWSPSPTYQGGHSNLDGLEPKNILAPGTSCSRAPSSRKWDAEMDSEPPSKRRKMHKKRSRGQLTSLQRSGAEHGDHVPPLRQETAHMPAYVPTLGECAGTDMHVPPVRMYVVAMSCLSGVGSCGFLLTEQSRVFYDTPDDYEAALPEGLAGTPTTAMRRGTDSTFPVAKRLSVRVNHERWSL
ncbi:hypothetical protein B0H11DRAFT_1931410 [Mycena galericulata]|nr:hypothetical protein B0H11DRAFT_1931410 [Mycena galericulata]